MYASHARSTHYTRASRQPPIKARRSSITLAATPSIPGPVDCTRQYSRHIGALSSCVLWLSMLGRRYLPWSSAALYIYTSPSWKQIVLNAKQPLCPSRQSISQQQRDAALARPRRATHTDNQHAREYRYGDVCNSPTSASGASYYSLPTWVSLHRVSHQLIAVAASMPPPTDPPTRPIRSSDLHRQQQQRLRPP
eukprot:COSAG01_NODE_3437_length_6098_cov_5.799800_2_plen_194_part_00